MNLKQFIDEYKNCPLCDFPTTITSDQGETIIHNNKLTISIKTQYFMEPNIDTFEFSILIINGNISFTNSTNQFISLYELDILLKRECQNCKSFSRTIKLFYDRSVSAFKAIPYIEYFKFYYNSVLYVIVNYNDKNSDLMITDYNTTSLEKYYSIPHIPFNRFDFSNEEKLFSKINSILLLK
jgi:hypothetical protein